MSLHCAAPAVAQFETFNYAVLDADETELLGCVYIRSFWEPDPSRLRSPMYGATIGRVKHETRRFAVSSMEANVSAR